MGLSIGQRGVICVMTSADKRPLRPGDVVEVRSAAEILATLDGNAALDRMPFMPEMIRHVGRRYTVSRRVDKICDTIAATGSRRMQDTVYLDDLRCDGSAHGGCQQAARSTGRRHGFAASTINQAQVDASTEAAVKLEHLAQAGTRTVREIEGKPSEVWRCQVTEAFVATEPLPTSNLSQYWRELTNGNFSLFRFIFIALRGLPIEIGRRIGLIKPVPLQARQSSRRWQSRSILSPATSCKCSPRDEIAATLDDRGFNRGLSFDREMLPYCGRTFRVRDRVQQVIDDKTGRMLKITKDCTHPRGCRLFGRAQRRALVLSASDISILAR